MTIDDNYFLVFNAHFDRTKGLDYGRLSLNSLNRGTIKIWLAASSISTKQYPESFHDWGGYLPPQYRVPGLKHWEVETQPIDLTHVKGVEGNFYRLVPHAVTTDKGGHRSDFGIHLDANAPGSLGCIVMSLGRFKDFENYMSELRESGIKKIPQYVFYS